jgi:hypothetical protein
VPSEAIKLLLAEIRSRYGDRSLSFYGTSEDEHDGTCFRITGIPMTFSVHTRAGTLPEGHYDVQIEGTPPGDYLYTNVVNLDTFIKLVSAYAGPQHEWPSK